MGFPGGTGTRSRRPAASGSACADTPVDELYTIVTFLDRIASRFRRRSGRTRRGFAAALLVAASPGSGESREPLAGLLERHCADCHDEASAKGGLDLTRLPFELDDPSRRERWIRIHDRIERGEMPPRSGDLPEAGREALLSLLGSAIGTADAAEVRAQGRGPMRRLNRDEYQENLRAVLDLPALDIRDRLPEDRESHHFTKTAGALDLSRVQLEAYLDAAEAALREAIAPGTAPPPTSSYRALATRLFEGAETFGNREAMFYAKDSQAIPMNGRILAELRKSGRHDPAVEMALFRSAHWPYYGYPQGFVAARSGDYRVRFSARAVVQRPGYLLGPAPRPVPMTFRARKPSGPDVSGDVRATGGLIDIVPEGKVYETTVRLRERETFEYSLLGLPVPLARNVDGGPPTYRYPPLPEGGQPGVAFQWIEVEGPLPPESWPPPSHRVLFGDLPVRAAPAGADWPVEVASDRPERDAARLLRRFADRAARQPVPEEGLAPFEHLVRDRLSGGAGFAEAMMAGYQAFLSSGHFLFLPEPAGPADAYAIASRLSHFLTNSPPDGPLLEAAREGRLADPAGLRAETDRLVASPGFDRFVRSFTDSWLGLKHLRRDDPDVRLYPEYRFDDYLVESMEGETRAFFAALIRENHPVRALIEADFVFANDRLSHHYGLEPLAGSAMRKVLLPPGDPRGGLLTQAAILKVTANGTNTSPVVRGAWVMERIIGRPPPPPPASVPAAEPDIRGAKTIREILARHAEQPSCASCHAQFDPVGLALEAFDILGGRRERYRGLEEGERVTGIDRAGHDYAYTLAGPVDPSGRLADGRPFRDIRDLKALLAADSRQLGRNLLHQFTVYATGTPVRFSDRPGIESLLDSCAADGYRAGDLLRELVASPIFLGRGADRAR